LEKFVTTYNLWQKLAKSKQYRSAYALAFLKRSVPFQIRVLRKKHCSSQSELAERSGVTQGVVSRAEDPDYGNLTLNTIGRIAGGLDMAFVGRFVPFSELRRFAETLSEEEFESILTFNEESAFAVDLESVDSFVNQRKPVSATWETPKHQPKLKEPPAGQLIEFGEQSKSSDAAGYSQAQGSVNELSFSCVG
jgi:transcriptional regulator with XRE-family HTH domain